MFLRRDPLYGTRCVLLVLSLPKHPHHPFTELVEVDQA